MLPPLKYNKEKKNSVSLMDLNDTHLISLLELNSGPPE